MSVLLQCQRITHALGTKTLFRNIDLTINSHDRIGLVGHNGSGKSTLLAILNGSQKPDEGELSRSNGLALETVEQFIDDDLLEESLFAALSMKIPEEERGLSDYRAEKLLAQLGFAETDLNYRVEDLSGGQQNRLMFARAVINEPNLILFDEPTNHLDLKTLLFFEEFLSTIDAAFLLISHDRQFLDGVTGRTLFLRDERLYGFALPFTAAREQLAHQDLAAEAARKSEDKKIDGLKASAKRLALWGKVYDNEKLARKAKSMEKRIEKMQDSRTFVTRGSGLSLTLDVDQARAKQMLRIENQPIHAPTPRPPGPVLFHVDDFLLRPGDRVALLGHNGVGKTTLIKLIVREYQAETQTGVVTFNPRFRIGYYDQELDNLDDSRSLTETLRDNCQGSENDYKTALIRSGFPYRDLDKKVAVLSGGEKARLMFLMIKLNQPNLLILDEPTNHIDIQGKEELEEQILGANATVLITSHDRRFVDTIADRFVLIHEGRLREIGDPTAFYAMDPAPIPNVEAATANPAAYDEESMLQRIVTLEKLLADDLERKPKFQKRKLQQEWRSELAELNNRL